MVNSFAYIELKDVDAYRVMGWRIRSIQEPGKSRVRMEWPYLSSPIHPKKEAVAS